jgi:hypothetical protein
MEQKGNILSIASIFVATVVACSALHAAIADPVRIDSGLISGVQGASSEIRARLPEEQYPYAS